MSALHVTGAAQRAAWQASVLPAVERVRDGLWSIPVPLPDNPLRYVLVHLFELEDGVAVVDTGWDTDTAWDALVAGLGVAGASVSDVRAILITHIHPDHYGLAGRLRQVSGAWVALHRDDAALLPGRYGAGVEAVLAQMRQLLEEAGVPAEVVAELSEASTGVREWVQLAEPDVILEHRAAVPLRGWDLVALHTPGHSPGHVCFWERGRRVLLSGDHVLPRISPTIAMHVQQTGNPLADYLAALRAVRDLDVDEVLPAHEWRFAPLRERVDQLLDHHQRRLALVENTIAAGSGATVWEVAQQLPWSRPWAEIQGHMRRAAVGETLAHLVTLAAERRAELVPGSHPWRWRAVRAPW